MKKKDKTSKDEDVKKKKGTVKQGYAMLNKRAARALNSSDDDDEDEDDDGDSGKSIFREHALRIKQLEEDGVTGEAYDLEVLKSMRAMVLDLIPVAEENYRKFPLHTAASAVNQYVNQERELLNDIRQLEDFQARSDKLISLVEDEYQTIAKDIIQSVGNLENLLKAKGSAQLFKDFRSLQGKSLEASKNRVAARIRQLLMTDDDKKR